MPSVEWARISIEERGNIMCNLSFSIRRTVLFAIVTFVFAAITQTTHAIQCGDTITTDTTLTANLGPCPSDGLVLSGTEVTLNLNGHTITGSSGGDGLKVQGGVVTIKGPGTIAKFGTGISVYAIGGPMMVYNLVLSGNGQGIWTGPPFNTSNMRILNNVITARNSAGNGITAAQPSNVYIYQNTISGYAVGVDLLDGVMGVVDENLITLNQTGILTSFPDYLCFTIRGNRVLFNHGDGIRAGHNYGSLEIARMTDTCNGAGGDIEDNSVNFNGGSGIVVQTGSLGSSQSVQDNMVSFNKTDGIAVFGMPGSLGAAVQVIGNYTSSNGTDLFWDGTGTTDCWQEDIFSTSSPQALPGC